MIFKRYELGLALRIVLMFLLLAGTAWVSVHDLLKYLLILVPAILFFFVDLYKFNRRTHKEMEQFVEGVRYRDFSRHYNVQKSPGELVPVRKGFNEINETFRTISKERETQHHYLQNILELIDTGILSYDMETGEVMWMNDALRKLLQLPYLRTIQGLSKRNKELAENIMRIRPAEQMVISAAFEKKTVRMLLSATAFSIEGKKFKLIAFQNVNDALEENESQAWQKLLSVMTHEIMNSVAPISSLAETLGQRLEHNNKQENMENGILEDLKLGIETIKKRSEGLLKFAETYRYLNKITKPHLSKVYARDLFESLNYLMGPTIEKKGIELEIILNDPDIYIQADSSLIEQVLINLVLNAIDAVKEQTLPRIALSAFMNETKRIVIKVADNGPGIDDEVRDKIFIPFFSTKKNGSGIGLSLCKQIMVLHKGSIQALSRKNEGTAFILEF